MRVDGFFDWPNPAVKVAGVKIVLMWVSNHNQVVTAFAELIQHSNQRGRGAINRFEDWNQNVPDRIIDAQRAQRQKL
ncbi:hypothetical protein EPN42_15845 [bacterium]|nr:MAG: hypothetical protein EPN42_15845 [bacterium]